MVSFIVGLLNYSISIHALAKRATSNKLPCCLSLCDFNPRPRKEGDSKQMYQRSSHFVFQSTPSQRGRQILSLPFFAQCLFQSTPSQRGRRFYQAEEDGIILISIHALAKRATKSIKDNFVFAGNFNPRPRKEGDLATLLPQFTQRAFQSTPSQRGRQFMRTAKVAGYQFQSTPSQRGRHK